MASQVPNSSRDRTLRGRLCDQQLADALMRGASLEFLAPHMHKKAQRVRRNKEEPFDLPLRNIYLSTDNSDMALLYNVLVDGLGIQESVDELLELLEHLNMLLGSLNEDQVTVERVATLFRAAFSDLDTPEHFNSYIESRNYEELLLKILAFSSSTFDTEWDTQLFISYFSVKGTMGSAKLVDAMVHYCKMKNNSGLLASAFAWVQPPTTVLFFRLHETLLFNPDFWKLLEEHIFTSRALTLNVAFILQKCTEALHASPRWLRMFPRIVYNSEYSDAESRLAWEGFIEMLILYKDDDREAFNLQRLENVHKLPSRWQVCIYKQFLKQPHPVTIFKVQEKVFKVDAENWEFYSEILCCLIHKASQLSSSVMEVVAANVNQLARRMSDMAVVRFIVQAVEAAWTALALKEFCAAFLLARNVEVIPFGLLFRLLEIIERVPHARLRAVTVIELLEKIKTKQLLGLLSWMHFHQEDRFLRFVQLYKGALVWRANAVCKIIDRDVRLKIKHFHKHLTIFAVVNLVREQVSSGSDREEVSSDSLSGVRVGVEENALVRLFDFYDTAFQKRKRSTIMKRRQRRFRLFSAVIRRY